MGDTVVNVRVYTELKLDKTLRHVTCYVKTSDRHPVLAEFDKVIDEAVKKYYSFEKPAKPLEILDEELLTPVEKSLLSAPLDKARVRLLHGEKYVIIVEAQTCRNRHVIVAVRDENDVNLFYRFNNKVFRLRPTPSTLLAIIFEKYLLPLRKIIKAVNVADKLVLSTEKQHVKEAIVSGTHVKIVKAPKD